MRVLGIINHFGIRVASEEFGIDAQGHITTASALFPDKAEMIYGTLASVIIFAGLWKFAGPQIAKGMKARTARIQKELDDAAADKAAAVAEAAQIRQAKGDIEAERARLLAAAQVQAQTVIEDGRLRLELEVTELEAKAAADVIAARARVFDELRAEIVRLSIAAVDQVVTGSLDEATHQRLIEDFISRVGASTAAGARS
ncbi:MAG: atpF [Ilumatobacteraceae bacterium]|nr:atpF [Ilumatobacteraceae bacterium]